MDRPLWIPILYALYYIPLIFGFVIAIRDPLSQVPGIIVVAVTSAHFVVGGLRILCSADKTAVIKDHFNSLAAKTSDVLILSGLALGIIAVANTELENKLSSAVIVAFIGNTFCVYNNLIKPSATATSLSRSLF